MGEVQSLPALRRHQRKRWAIAFLVGVCACGLAFVANVLLAEVRAGNPWGVSYGILGTLLLIAAVLLGWRRRSMRASARVPLGSARAWLYVHIYGGSLFLVLVFMHVGFRLPTGALSWVLWILSVWTAFSGAIGLLIQKWIPRALASGLRLEVNYDRIPELIDQIRERADAIAATCGDAAQRTYNLKIAPRLIGPERRVMYFIDITGGIEARLRDLRYLRHLQSSDEAERLDELERLYRAKLEIDAHYTLQPVLRYWLYAHVPLSLLLTALVAVHIFVVWYY